MPHMNGADHQPSAGSGHGGVLAGAGSALLTSCQSISIGGSLNATTAGCWPTPPLSTPAAVQGCVLIAGVELTTVVEDLSVESDVALPDLASSSALLRLHAVNTSPKSTNPINAERRCWLGDGATELPCNIIEISAAIHTDDTSPTASGVHRLATSV